jgi:hypothetical protein
MCPNELFLWSTRVAQPKGMLSWPGRLHTNSPIPARTRERTAPTDDSAARSPSCQSEVAISQWIFDFHEKSGMFSATFVSVWGS